MTLRNRWQLRKAKNRLSEAVRLAQSDGPRNITVRGEDAVVVISAAEFRREHPETHGAPELTLYELSRAWVDKIGDIDLDLDRDYGPPTLDPWHE
jgi:prevent-host-death family protein